MEEQTNRIHPELIEIERAKRIREEEEKTAAHDDMKTMTHLDYEHHVHQGSLVSSSINDRYDIAMQNAESKVTAIWKKQKSA